MLTNRQMDIMLSKLKRFETTLESLLFLKVDEVAMSAFCSDGRYHKVPEWGEFKPCSQGDYWDKEGGYCWFRGDYIVPEHLHRAMLYVYPKIDGYEGLLWVNQKPYGNFGSKIRAFDHGNHYCNLLVKQANVEQHIDIAFEFYAHHYVIGTKPFEINPNEDFKITYHSVDICVRNEAVWDAYFNLKIINQMVEGMNSSSFRRSELIKALLQMHKIIYYDNENIDIDVFYNRIHQSNDLLKKALAVTNSASSPYAGLIGHSHMDTAWLWDIRETIKKCARTYSNQISLMDQYPDYHFVQSSAYHTELIREYYPDLFQAIKEKVMEGRYEPNGGVYIECDCNIPSGEYLIRQFLWGQSFTEEIFSYRSDAFWLPDTFGYSAALPQIMKGCGVRYFLTTKLMWGDTTEFPYDTFYWKGIDGTIVFVHFNKTHTGPEPKYMLSHVLGENKDSIIEKTVSNMRLLSYGEGDGGGGPTFEMIEVANRLRDVEGLPRSSHIKVGEFMKCLEKTSVEVSTYCGELYLELHRGTLTNQHIIKRNNRLAEISLRNLEYITVRSAIRNNEPVLDDLIKPLMKDLLVNQFHDILPGTCISLVHEQSKATTSRIIDQSEALLKRILSSRFERYMISVLNTLSFERRDVIYLDYLKGFIVKGDYKQQLITDLNGKKKLALRGVSVPSFAGITLELVPGSVNEKSVFVFEDGTLQTPFATVRFDDKGYIQSFIDRRANRELRGNHYPLNAFLMAEDVPNDWDNWDVDADIAYKFVEEAKLLSRAVISNGEVEFRIRSKYQISEKSSLYQDMIFYADSPEVRFDTLINWQDHHRFLKTAFDTSIQTNFARHEIQFGYIMRPTNNNTAVEKAKYEVSNYKYTDISENRYGVAILNDCKYGIYAKDASLRLSLHKGGCRPDDRGDKGVHSCCYSFYPHNEGFKADNVIRTAYLLNYKPIIVDGVCEEDSLLRISEPNIIIEAVKPPKLREKAYILRLYEAEGTYTNTVLTFHHTISGAEITNMLEEKEEELPLSQEIELSFRAFEIKTLKVYY